MSLYWLTQVYASGKLFIGEYLTKAEAFKFHNAGLKRNTIVRSAVDEYDSETDPFEPVWKVIVDVDKTKPGGERVNL